MGRKTRNEVAVGLTVLAVLALTVYIVIILGDWSSLFADKQRVTMQVGYEQGLRGIAAGSPVLLGGTKIGTVPEAGVAQETLAGGEPVAVYFVMELPREYPLRADCVLAAEGTMLGGQAAVAVKDLGSEGRLLEDGDTLRVELQGGIADAMAALGRELDTDNPEGMLSQIKAELDAAREGSLLASIKTVVGNLEQITLRIDEQLVDSDDKATLMAKLQATLSNLEGLSGSLRAELEQPGMAEEQAGQTALVKVHAALDSLNGALANAREMIEENRPGVKDSVDSMRAVSANLAERMPEIMAQVEEALTTANQAMVRGRETLERLRNLSGDAHEMLVINRESINRMITNFDELSVNLKMTSREVRRAPWRLLYQPDEDELEIQALVDAAGGFAAGAERLDEAAVRLRALLQADNISEKNEEVVRNLMAELQTSFEQFQQAERKLWEQLD